MNDIIREKMKENEKILLLIPFCVVALAVILGGTLGLHVNVVSVCVMVIAEAALAVVLYHVELWIHGVVVLLEILEGVLFERSLLVFCCVAVYLAAIVTLRMIGKPEKKR